MTITESCSATGHSHRGVRQEIVARVEEILPIPRRNADQAEADRKIPDESWNACCPRTPCGCSCPPYQTGFWPIANS